jgi:hypothetical protein
MRSIYGFLGNEFGLGRKRDNKTYAKKEAAATGVKMCIACNLYHDKLKKKTDVCHNCYKIFDGAYQIVDKNRGAIEFNQATKEFQLTCAAAHTWTVPFKVKL